jgi:8-amino-3,8-dideoxy-alpha-D-manno-octulosonate transaminase
MSEYHDHGHDHVPNPGGRGGEGRPFIGFNYRMMEIQGALGLAQLAKLDGMVAAQKQNKQFFQEAASVLPGVEYREILDPAGESATFFCFMLPDRERAEAVNQALRQEGVGAVRWRARTAGTTIPTGTPPGRQDSRGNGWPFTAHGKRRIVYDPRDCRFRPPCSNAP